MSYNKVFLMGTIESKEIIQANNGGQIIKFVLKTWEKEHRELIDCVAYSTIARIIIDDFPPGRSIFIEGKAHTYLEGEIKLTQVIVERFRSYSLNNYEF